MRDGNCCRRPGTSPLLLLVLTGIFFRESASVRQRWTSQILMNAIMTLVLAVGALSKWSEFAPVSEVAVKHRAWMESEQHLTLPLLGVEVS